MSRQVVLRTPGHETSTMQTDSVLVNHNTAPYAELALRSLFFHNPDAPVSVTLLDNGSTESTRELFTYAAATGITVLQSGHSVDAGRNTHGENLARFVLDHSSTEYFLFMDSDICFLENGTLASMSRQLEACPEAWAVQAKMKLFVELLDPSWVPGATPSLFWRVVTRTGEDFSEEDSIDAFRAAKSSHRGSFQTRPHPFCLLIRNSPTFLRVVESVGFSTALINADLPWGGWYDTAALAAKVLASHGLSWFVSEEKPVLHYAWVSERREDSALTEAKLKDCQRRLAEYRLNDRGLR
jgi:hypothetical protein